VVKYLKALDVAALALNAGLYVAFGYIFFYILPLTTPVLGTVRFWPQVIIPAVFAVIFGPWVGGFGAAIGIFISDMLIHGNAILSLMAGVTSNFAMFAIIGFVAKKNTDWKISMLGFGIINVLLVWIAFTFLSSDAVIYSGIIVVSYIILLVIVGLTPKWRGYEAGSMMGLLVGSAIIGTMVPVFSQFFFMPGNTQLTPLTVSGGFAYLIWTFATEIPFLIVLGPPILEACYKAYPGFNVKKKVNDSEKNR
jgi:hypothetical protein